MKFIIIIITVIATYFLVIINKSVKEKTKNANNMILCEICGYHVLKQDICDTDNEINKCPNKNER